MSGDMICPVCRSQNLETAKFCGNCGSPFPRSAPPSSSLQNCAQGHVYSAVYEHCPYCPQPERAAPTPADFATRIETPLETVMETPVPSVPPQASARTEKMRRDYNTLIEPGATGAIVSTDPITSSPTGDPTNEPARPAEPITFSTQPSMPSTPSLRTNSEPESPPVIPPPPPPPGTPKTPSRPISPPVSESAAKPHLDRRTVVVQPDNAQPSTSKGRLVGWLVTFSSNTDGTDYHLRAGRNVLGANPNCDIIVDDEAVSGVHASIVYRQGHCFIKDELSSNGTFVNGVEVQEPRPLQNYDQVRIGNTTLTFVGVERTA